MRRYTGFYRWDVHQAKYRQRVNQAAREQLAPKKPGPPKTPAQVKNAITLWTYIICVAVCTLIAGSIGGAGSGLSLVGFLFGFALAAGILAGLKEAGKAQLAKTATPVPKPKPKPKPMPQTQTRNSANNLTESEKGFTVEEPPSSRPPPPSPRPWVENLSTEELERLARQQAKRGITQTGNARLVQAELERRGRR